LFTDLPSSFGFFDRATHKISIFLAANNFLNGTIPSEIGNMVALEVLNVADNDLTGTIPTEIGLLTSMKKLNFSTSNFVLDV
jgi:hypothetical protein